MVMKKVVVMSNVIIPINIATIIIASLMLESARRALHNFDSGAGFVTKLPDPTACAVKPSHNSRDLNVYFVDDEMRYKIKRTQCKDAGLAHVVVLDRLSLLEVVKN